MNTVKHFMVNLIFADDTFSYGKTFSKYSTNHCWKTPYLKFPWKKIEPCLVALLIADNTFSETVEKIFEQIM